MSALVAAPTQQDDEIPHDGDVDGDDGETRQGYVSPQLVELERNERARDDDGEVFRPALSKEQADAFGQEQGGINKRARADRSQLAVIDRQESGQQAFRVAT